MGDRDLVLDNLFELQCDASTCTICRDVITTPMLLPCSHTFCALCIRRVQLVHDKCPVCFVPASVTALNPNPTLQGLLHRQRDCLTAAPEYIHKKERYIQPAELEQCEYEHIDCEHCYIAIKKEGLPTHVSICPKNPSVSRPVDLWVNDMQYLPYLVYTLYNLSDLRRILLELGFPQTMLAQVKGNKDMVHKTFVELHRSFVVHYNSAVDEYVISRGVEIVDAVEIRTAVIREYKMMRDGRHKFEWNNINSTTGNVTGSTMTNGSKPTGILGMFDKLKQPTVAEETNFDSDSDVQVIEPDYSNSFYSVQTAQYTPTQQIPTQISQQVTDNVQVLVNETVHSPINTVAKNNQDVPAIYPGCGYKVLISHQRARKNLLRQQALDVQPTNNTALYPQSSLKRQLSTMSDEEQPTQTHPSVRSKSTKPVNTRQVWIQEQKKVLVFDAETNLACFLERNH